MSKSIEVNDLNVYYSDFLAVEGVSLVGSAVDDWNDERWRSRVAESFAATGATGDRVDAVAKSTRYIKADVAAESEWRRVLDACDGSVVIYFALPPAITASCIRMPRPNCTSTKWATKDSEMLTQKMYSECWPQRMMGPASGQFTTGACSGTSRTTRYATARKWSSRATPKLLLSIG